MKTSTHFLQWLTIVLLLAVNVMDTMAQGTYTATEPHSVCLNSVENYRVTRTEGSSYDWTIINPDFTTSTDWVINGNGTSDISVEWKAVGLYKLKVIETKNFCLGDPKIIEVTVTALPTADISYLNSPWCATATSQPVTLTGTGAYTGGVYSSTAGLIIDLTTGTIDPAASTAGTYTVTYTTVASAGCGTVSATTSVTITALPTADISYLNSPWCATATSQPVTLTGTGAYTGGVYSSTSGLIIDPTTGTIDPATSTAGTYTVTYTTVASAGCGTVSATTSVIISPQVITSPIYHN